MSLHAHSCYVFGELSLHTSVSGWSFQFQPSLLVWRQHTSLSPLLLHLWLPHISEEIWVWIQWGNRKRRSILVYNMWSDGGGAFVDSWMQRFLSMSIYGYSGNFSLALISPVSIISTNELIFNSTVKGGTNLLHSFNKGGSQWDLLWSYKGTTPLLAKVKS